MRWVKRDAQAARGPLGCVVGVAGDEEDAVRVLPVLRTLADGDPVVDTAFGAPGDLPRSPLSAGIRVVPAAVGAGRLGARRFDDQLRRLRARVVVVSGHGPAAAWGVAAAVRAGLPVCRLGAGRGDLASPPGGDPAAVDVFQLAPTDADADRLVGLGLPSARVVVTGDPAAAGWHALAGTHPPAVDAAVGRVLDRSEPVVVVACDDPAAAAQVAVAVHALTLMNAMSVVWELGPPTGVTDAVRAAVVPALAHCRPVVLVERLALSDRVRLAAESRFVVTDRADLAELAAAFGRPALPLQPAERLIAESAAILGGAARPGLVSGHAATWAGAAPACCAGAIRSLVVNGSVAVA